MSGRRPPTWDNVYGEAWGGLVLILVLYVWGLVGGWAHLPFGM